MRLRQMSVTIVCTRYPDARRNLMEARTLAVSGLHSVVKGILRKVKYSEPNARFFPDSSIIAIDGLTKLPPSPTSDLCALRVCAGVPWSNENGSPGNQG